jgi:hypothetical protein
VLKATFVGRLRVLELLGKHTDVKPFTDRHEHSGPGGTPIATSVIHVSYDANMKPPDEPTS